MLRRGGDRRSGDAARFVMPRRLERPAAARLFGTRRRQRRRVARRCTTLRPVCCAPLCCASLCCASMCCASLCCASLSCAPVRCGFSAVAARRPAWRPVASRCATPRHAASWRGASRPPSRARLSRPAPRPAHARRSYARSRRRPDRCPLRSSAPRPMSRPHRRPLARKADRSPPQPSAPTASAQRDRTRLRRDRVGGRARSRAAPPGPKGPGGGPERGRCWRRRWA